MDTWSLWLCLLFMPKVLKQFHTHSVAPTQVCRLLFMWRGAQRHESRVAESLQDPVGYRIDPHIGYFPSRSGVLRTPVVRWVEIWRAVLAKVCFSKEGRKSSNLPFSHFVLDIGTCSYCSKRIQSVRSKNSAIMTHPQLNWQDRLMWTMKHPLNKNTVNSVIVFRNPHFGHCFSIGAGFWCLVLTDAYDCPQCRIPCWHDRVQKC